MLGCTPYSEEEESVVMNDPEEYGDWLSKKEDEYIERERGQE